ncbi:hypothetical protein ACLQ2M_41455, partial [Streptomyces sp. DT7]
MRGRGPARAVAAGAAVVTVAAGLGVRTVADGDLAKSAGDALYTVLVCALVALCAPRARPVVWRARGWRSAGPSSCSS